MSELHVLFQVGDAHYAVSADRVLVMESYEGATRVPGTAPWVAGLVHIRGEVVPVVDLRARFGLPAVERTLDHRVVVVREGERTVGLLVDSAREVVSIAGDLFREPPEPIARSADRFVRSVAKTGDRLVMLIDIERVIGAETTFPVPQSQTEEAHGEQRTD